MPISLSATKSCKLASHDKSSLAYSYAKFIYTHALNVTFQEVSIEVPETQAGDMCLLVDFQSRNKVVAIIAERVLAHITPACLL